MPPGQIAPVPDPSALSDRDRDRAFECCACRSYGAERLRLGRRIAGAPARRRSTKATPGLGFGVVAYVLPDRRSNAALEAGESGGVDLHNTDYNLNAAIGAAYGITYQLTTISPSCRTSQQSAREAETMRRIRRPQHNVSGIGKLSIPPKMHYCTTRVPASRSIGGIELPTGSTHQRSRDGERLETERRPGTGSWDPIFGASLRKTRVPSS